VKSDGTVSITMPAAISRPKRASMRLKIDSDLNREHQGVAYEPRTIGTDYSLDIRLHVEPGRRILHVIQLEDRFVRHRRLMVHPLRFAQIAGELAEDCEQAQRVLTALRHQTLVQQPRFGKSICNASAQWAHFRTR
jgi:hypothetical protein